MNGELLAAVALAGHGTVWLRGPAGDAPSLDETHPLFQFVRSARFRPPPRRLLRWDIQPPDIRGVAPWLRSLRSRRIERLWLVVPMSEPAAPLPEHIAVAFAGGGSWSLVATGATTTQAWTPVWELGDPDEPDSAIWDISCTGVTVDAGLRPPPADLDAADAGLVRALTAIRAFAHEHERGSWADYFDRALAAPDPDTERRAFDVLPLDDYPEAAHRLLAKASSSWVFGGMGSWNDLGAFDTAEINARYDEVSADLYQAILGAVTAAVNAPLP